MQKNNCIKKIYRLTIFITWLSNFNISTPGTNKGGNSMWPFDKRLRDQDALEKYRRWLKRWLLGAVAKAAPKI
jgi:hypothetical protein